MERFSGKGRKYVCGRKIRKEISVTGSVMGIVEDKFTLLRIEFLSLWITLLSDHFLHLPLHKLLPT